MWGYFGSKSKVVHYYPEPVCDKIIEPFAGTAQYSLRYFDRQVLLIDSYDVVVRIWKWLQQCSPKDILDLPRLKEGQSVDDFNWDCDEAKWLVGFIISAGAARPRKVASPWRTGIWASRQDFKLKQISENLYKIRHWVIELGDFFDADNEEATWFIDAPYSVKGTYYKSAVIDYSDLADWCIERAGQLIVCEQYGAAWLPFEPLVVSRGVKSYVREVVLQW